MSVVEYTEKRTLKKAHQKLRKIYATTRPSEKPGGLRNSVTRSAVKITLKPRSKKFVKEDGLRISKDPAAERKR
jgi:hypothetical protein